MGEEAVVLEGAAEEMVVIFSEVVFCEVFFSEVVYTLGASVPSSAAFLQTTSEVLLPGNSIPLLHLQMKKCLQISSYGRKKKNILMKFCHHLLMLIS